MGINNLLGAKDLFFDGKNLLDVYPNLGGLWDLINMMANTAFVFLPSTCRLVSNEAFWW